MLSCCLVRYWNYCWSVGAEKDWVKGYSIWRSSLRCVRLNWRTSKVPAVLLLFVIRLLPTYERECFSFLLVTYARLFRLCVLASVWVSGKLTITTALAETAWQSTWNPTNCSISLDLTSLYRMIVTLQTYLAISYGVGLLSIGFQKTFCCIFFCFTTSWNLCSVLSGYTDYNN